MIASLHYWYAEDDDGPLWVMKVRCRGWCKHRLESGICADLRSSEGVSQSQSPFEGQDQRMNHVVMMMMKMMDCCSPSIVRCCCQVVECLKRCFHRELDREQSKNRPRMHSNLKRDCWAVVARMKKNTAHLRLVCYTWRRGE
jgi:hypothetical protein